MDSQSEQVMAAKSGWCLPVTNAVEGASTWFCSGDYSLSGCLGTILFVEDEVFVREVTSEILRCAGYRVLTARNTAEAFRIYDQSGSEVDLLLTDVILPGETGPALAAKLRRENTRLKVLFVTGYGEEMAARSEAQEECLAKPFSSEVLLRSIKALLDQPPCGGPDKDQFMHACVVA